MMKSKEEIEIEILRLKRLVKLFEDMRLEKENEGEADKKLRNHARLQLLKECGKWQSITPKLWKREIQNLEWVFS